MKRLLFKDLIHPNNGMSSDAPKIKSLALKQISRGRFEIEGNEIISKIRYLEEEMKIVFTNDISIEDFRNQLYIAFVKEKSLDFMYEKTSMCNSTLFQMVQDYKQKNYIRGSEMEDTIWFKLYSKTKIKNDMRELYQAEWIDYENQLEDGNVIYDVRGMSGLFAMTKDMLVNCFNEECRDRYGDNLLVVKSISDCFYLNDKMEIIGDRFEVIDRIDFKCFEDVGRLIEYLQNIDAKVAEKIKEKSDDTIRSLKKERTELIDELNDLYGAFGRTQATFIKMKSRKWLWFISGFVLGIIMSSFIN